jgi:2-polyprenyl-6-methoxyphenol hydroxylase-like FAD-dependent oxidoreductase
VRNGRVLIVGAGPTGLTAAVELARLGVAADVIDRKDEGSSLSRAVGILPRSLELLASSGVTERLLAEGVRLQEFRLYNGPRHAMFVPTHGAHPQHDFVLALAQDRTEGVLRDVLTASGGSVRYGTELTGLRQDGERVVVETGDGVESEYEIVIGADGTRSTVRKSLGLDFDGHDLPETWSIADVDAMDWPNGNALTLCLLPEGRVVVVAPLEAERFRVVSNTEDALATLPLELDVTNIRRKGQFTISIRQVAEYRIGRVYLAGDAAHCHSPVGGRGMNLGIADAAELASRLVEDRLDGYSQSRHADGAATILRHSIEPARFHAEGRGLPPRQPAAAAAPTTREDIPRELITRTRRALRIAHSSTSATTRRRGRGCQPPGRRTS